MQLSYVLNSCLTSYLLTYLLIVTGVINEDRLRELLTTMGDRFTDDEVLLFHYYIILTVIIIGLHRSPAFLNPAPGKFCRSRMLLPDVKNAHK